MHISRRDFLRSAALGSAALTAACRASLPASAPFNLPADAGRVISARNPMVWQKGNLSAEGLREMLDASIAALTREPDAGKAWASICRPSDRVAIKVNGVVRGSTHVPLVLAVADRLQAAGVRPDRITIYDRTTGELRDAGFPITSSGDQVRCYGTNDDYAGDWTIQGTRIRLSRVLVDCDALLNIPVLKAFTIGGMSFAMKNHYGSFDIPDRFHGGAFASGVTALNALEPIHARTRLIIGDVLSPDFREDSADYAVIGGESTVLVASDPVALDRVGLQMATEALARVGRDPHSVEAWAMGWLSESGKRGLGVGDLERIRVERVKM